MCTADVRTWGVIEVVYMRRLRPSDEKCRWQPGSSAQESSVWLDHLMWLKASGLEYFLGDT